MNGTEAKGGTLSHEEIQHGLDEIKGMREEINWRVKVAYNSSLIFLSVIAFTVGTLFNSDNKLLEAIITNPELKVQVGIALVVLISAWVGVQNANHIIEKRIELYTLSVYRVISEAGDRTYFGWIPYLYGSRFFEKSGANSAAKVLNASIGLFIYLLPNAIGIGVWVYLLVFNDISQYSFYFVIATIFLVIAIGTSALLFAYVIKLNNRSVEFYSRKMRPFDK